MHIPFVDLKAQYLTIKKDVDASIQDVINTTAFIGGKFVKEFEDAFASFTGRKYCVGVANGTDAIEVLLKALGIGPGDEVIVPANSFVATSEAVTAVGARVVFVDHHPQLYTIDVTKIEANITPKTKAIIPVHLYGLPAEMDEIVAIARKHKLMIVEDCAQGHGATYKGKLVGTFGEGATFSFYPGKNLGAYGDGGAVVTDNEDLAVKVRMIANHGRLSKHDHDVEGRNSRLDGMQAAILKVKLPHLDAWNEGRRRNAELYNKYLAGSGFQLPVAPAYSRHIYHLYVVQVANRAEVQEKLKAEGVDTGIHYPIALPYLKAYAYLSHKPKDFPVAHGQMGKILSLPMFAELTEEQIRHVSTLLKKYGKV